MTEVKEPKGVEFFSIQTGETMYARLEPTIAAFINSSDLSINASRGQDYGWRLGKSWVQRVREFKKNDTQMAILASKNGGQQPTTVQILRYLYSQDVAKYQRALQEAENPYEHEYLESIRETAPVENEPSSAPDLVDSQDDDMGSVIDEVVAPAKSTTKPKQKA